MSSVAAQGSAEAHGFVTGQREVAVIDLLDRLLHGGVVIHGQIMLTVADIDLVELDLRVVVSAIDRLAGPG